MKNIQAVFTSILMSFLIPLAAYADFSTTTHKVRSVQGCVNLRTEPSIDAAIIDCLQPGTDVAIFRIPPTGRFVWVRDEAGNVWYQASVPASNAVGWIIPECTDVLESAIEECTDLSS